MMFNNYENDSPSLAAPAIILIAALALLAFSTPVTADAEPPEPAAAPEAARAEYEAMLEEAERARMEAESARAEATKAATLARQAARMQRDLHRAESESRRELSEDERRERKLQRQLEEEELDRVRDELSRAHREMREATREIARAHRDMARARSEVNVQYINLGDRAVIGVALGENTEDGIRVAGVSPDGPAERAGLSQGDIIVSIEGADLSSKADESRSVLTRTIAEAEEGQELVLTVQRDGETIDLLVVPERREPGSWQTVIRIPDTAMVAPVAPGAPEVMKIERIVAPEIDVEALNDQVNDIMRRVKENSFVFTDEDGKVHEWQFDEDFDFEFDEETFSTLGLNALHETDILFGFNLLSEMELASINEGLGEYFKTDRGVLVLSAQDDNVFELRPGDVVLEINGRAVDSPSDMMRALREVEPLSEMELQIKRDRRNETLNVAMPERRLGYEWHHLPNG